MADEQEIHEEQLALGGVGEKLRVAREAKGLSLTQIAADTRINERHLKLIDAGEFSKLPGKTYAIGFSRTYARQVGLDEVAIAAEVREEIAAYGVNEPSRAGATFEPGDPARIPSGKLVFAMIAAAILLIAGAFMFFRPFLMPGGELPALHEDKVVAARQTAQTGGAEANAPAAAAGPVIFTALEEGIWVKFYDVNGIQLMQKQMAKGETYAVPADAVGPQLWTGRPEALAITVGGKPVPKIAEVGAIMKDIPVNAAALVARGQTPPVAADPANVPPASGSGN